MKQKTNFKAFKIGKVFNPIKKINIKNPTPIFKKIIIKYPSRLEAMALDPSKIAINNNLKYSAGQINFKVPLFKIISIEVSNDNKVEISNRSERKSLIRHSVEIMRKAINFEEGFKIDVDDKINMKHCGLGSSSSLIAGIGYAINELYGKPISDNILSQYLPQNHGEEIEENNNMIKPVQCLGGSACSGICKGGMFILAGESKVIKSMHISKDYTVIIGIPKKYKQLDSQYLLDKEIKNFNKFIKTGKKYSPEIAYRLVHECMPAMEECNLKPIGDLIYEYRFNMGSIKNCSFAYPKILKISNNLRFLKEKGFADVLSMSSVGPGMFVITKNPKICEDAFIKQDMKIIKTKIYNGKYKIVFKK